jgi:hypothetical protein
MHFIYCQVVVFVVSNILLILAEPTLLVYLKKKSLPKLCIPS